MLRREVAALGAQKAGSSYFMIPFASQGLDNLASESHSFATFVKRDSDGHQEWQTISWLPADFYIHFELCVFRNAAEALWNEIWRKNCDPVRGYNYSVRESLEFSRQLGRALAVWGPYRISAELYALALEQIRLLESGAVDYLADDRRARSLSPRPAINCIHAISDLPGHQARIPFNPFGVWGFAGTRYVLRHFHQQRAEWFDEKPDVDKFRCYGDVLKCFGRRHTSSLQRR